jgi:D-tyrosyl-tRNA(Tyr) deacylase
MRLVLQRVSEACVVADGRECGRIERGICVLLGVGKGDRVSEADWCLEKLLSLRIFEDAAGKMNLDIVQVGGGLLIVSQFTLYGDTSRGRRPGFDLAAPADEALHLYEYFVSRAKARHPVVASGVFQASMRVHLVNDGPVTFIIERNPGN